MLVWLVVWEMICEVELCVCDFVLLVFGGVYVEMEVGVV